MKITNEELKQIIKEELEGVMLEQESEFPQSPVFINILITGAEGVRLVVKPKEGVMSPGVRIPKAAIDNMHPKMHEYITNMGVHYAEEEGWHTSLDPQTEANFYTILKRLIDRVDWNGSIGDYSIEDLKGTRSIVFSNYSGLRRRYTDQELDQQARNRKAALDR